MELFGEKSYSDFEFGILSQLKAYIKSIQSFDESLEIELAATSERFQLQKLVLDTADSTKEISIINVPIDYNRGEMSINGRKDIAIVEYTYNLVTNSDPNRGTLLSVKPSNYTSTPLKVNIPSLLPRLIRFSIPTNHQTKELPDEVINEVVKQRNAILSIIQTNVDNLNKDIIRINKRIHDTSLELITERMAHLDRMKDIHSKL